MGDEGVQLTNALQKEKNQFKWYLYSQESSSLIELHDAKNGQDVGFVKDNLKNVGFYVRSQVKTSLVGYSSEDKGNLYHLKSFGIASTFRESAKKAEPN